MRLQSCELTLRPLCSITPDKVHSFSSISQKLFPGLASFSLVSQRKHLINQSAGKADKLKIIKRRKKKTLLIFISKETEPER